MLTAGPEREKAQRLSEGGTTMEDKLQYRTVWISDVHLGTKACQVEPLLKFISSMRCENLFLVGDIIDLWAMKRKWYWPQTHNDVIRKILKRASKGTKVTYIPGNHDENFRGYLGLNFGGVEVKREAFHVTADGKRVLMIHGDEFDTVVKNHRIITWFGDWCYDLLHAGGRIYNWLRRKFGWPYFSLAAYVQSRVEVVVNFVSNYQQSLLKYARSRKAEIVVTGHIHRPEIMLIEDILYANCGDWVENCTALVEHADGRLELLKFDREDTSEKKPVDREEDLVETMA
jgi:UDP-2,3-diacylglucosamine pyrophosphatase LpxH